MRRHAVSSGLFLSLASLGCVLACTKQAPDSGVPRAQAAASRPPSLDNAEPSSVTAPTDAGVAAKPAADAAPAAPAAPADDAARARVHVKVVTIGMHVGGGPYDEPTKEPIKRSVEPHFADLARCWKLVSKPQQADVGVDLVIEAAGGRARVSNPRTTVTSEGFVPCVVTFFEGIDFLKPKSGKTVVSYSVRFSP